MVTPHAALQQRFTHVEIVYRWRVHAPDEFFDWLRGTIQRHLHNPSVPTTATAIRLSQPVLGPASDEWELRIEFPDLASLGTLFDSQDAEDPHASDLLWDLADVRRHWHQGRREVIAELLETRAPIYRTWVVCTGSRSASQNPC